jgi:GNAT superfamily N-acetyltransferase
MSKKELTIYYLEMNSINEFKPKPAVESFKIVESEIKQFKLNRFLYSYVGEAWNWYEKLSWSDEKWQEYVSNNNSRLWIGYFHGTPAGFYELQKQENGNIRISYFGLAPDFIDKGFGGYFLSHAIKQAWNWEKPKRVWVQTCTDDHPAALANYKARGFKVYKTEKFP